MKFVLERATATSGRLGYIRASNNGCECKLPTPMMLLTTQTGSVPHLTKDALERVLDSSRKHSAAPAAKTKATHESLALGKPVLSVPVQHFLNSHEALLAYNKGFTSFVGLPGHCVLATAQCSLTAPRGGYNNSQGVSVWTRSGRAYLKPKMYMQLVDAVDAVWCEALHDADTPPQCSNKRLAKSLASSYKYLEECLHAAQGGRVGLLVPLLGGWVLEQRQRWADKVKRLLKQDAGATRVVGYTLGGLSGLGAEAETLNPDQSLLTLLRASLEGADVALARVALGGFSPHACVALVAEGVDVLDSSLAAIAATRHCGLVFSYTPQMLATRLQDVAGEDGRPEGAHAAAVPGARKKRKKRHDDAVATSDEEDEERPYELNLNLACYTGSSRVLLPGCNCYTCSSGYTRGYIHHLCSSREMLAPVLLHMHNLHHMLGFMEVIRAAVAQDSLQDLKEILLGSYRPLRSTPEETQSPSEVSSEGLDCPHEAASPHPKDGVTDPNFGEVELNDAEHSDGVSLNGARHA